MIQLGSLVLGGETPRIAVSFGDGVSDEEISEAEYKGLDIAELRIDQFKSHDPAHVIREARRFSKFPTLATIRSKAEGGNWVRSDAERLTLFKKIIPEVDAVDIELSSEEILDAVIQMARAHKKVTLISYHNFELTPGMEELNSLIQKAKDRGCDIVKIAALARGQEDIKTLGDMTLHNTDKNIVSIAMGEKGTMSRVMFPALGSLFTFASMGKASAPGQLPFDEMVALIKKFYPDYKQ